MSRHSNLFADLRTLRRVVRYFRQVWTNRVRGSTVLDKIAALGRTTLFGELPATELELLAERAVEQKLDRGGILFLAGDAARGLYVIVEGAVRAFRVGADGREQVIHVERAGATVGEVPVFDEGAYPSTVAGEEDTVLLFLSSQDVRRMLTERPVIAAAALKVLARRLRNCAGLVETLSLHDVDRRLARFLITEARRAGVRDGKAIHFDFTLTHQQLASRIGTVREVVSRALSRLQQGGYLRLEGRRLTILDEKTFSGYAEAI
jgi:CRP/FNR family transcriptional regulator